MFEIPTAPLTPSLSPAKPGERELIFVNRMPFGTSPQAQTEANPSTLQLLLTRHSSQLLNDTSKDIDVPQRILA